jgi:hypothetical protein
MGGAGGNNGRDKDNLEVDACAWNGRDEDGRGNDDPEVDASVKNGTGCDEDDEDADATAENGCDEGDPEVDASVDEGDIWDWDATLESASTPCVTRTLAGKCCCFFILVFLFLLGLPSLDPA